MPRRPDAPPLTRGVLIRGSIFTVAVALGAVAVWLIVTSKTQKSIELGVLAGLWGLLLGTFSMLGTRRGTMGADPAPLASDTAEDDSGSEVEKRSNAAVERIEETLERRAWQERLEQLVRREIQEGVSREVSQLRAEIASLRGELLEKVGGQLRLERIETTRVIGSDLEALQHEVRQLKFAQDAPDVADMAARMVPTPVSRSVVQPAQVRPVSRQTAEVESDVQPARRVEPQPTASEPDSAPAPAPRPEQPDRSEQPETRRPAHHSAAADPKPAPAVPPERPVRARHSTPEDETGPIRATSWPVTQRPAPAAPIQPSAQTPQPQSSQPAPQPTTPRADQPAPAPQPAPRTAGRMEDDFAALPRLSPFIDIEPVPDPSSTPAASTSPAPNPYSGRRRRSDERDLDEANSARHADRPTGRRHRRDDEDAGAEAGDLLARLLSREGARH